MKRRELLVGLAALASGCGGGGAGNQERQTTQPAATETATVAASQVRPSPASIGGLPVVATMWGPVESEWMPDSVVMHQCGANNLCRASGYQPGTSPFIEGVVRFPYLFADSVNGVTTFYIIAGRVHGAGDLYLWSSANGISGWQLANCGEPVLRLESAGPLSWLANAAIAPIGDTWHMWIECTGGIAYSYCKPSVKKDFNANFAGVVIPNGGNPWVRVKADKIVLLHGMYQDGYFNNAWYTTRSEAPLTNPATMTVRRDLLMLGEDGVDICDPAYTTGTLLVSYNQDRVLALQTPLTFV
jgi:hypothetical protein